MATNAELATENAELRAMLETATKPEPAKRELRIMFRKPAKLTQATIAENAAAKKATTIANADVSGVFAGTSYDGLTVKDFAVSLMPDKTITVYMPASGPRAFYKHVGPRMVAVPENIEVLDANGERITHQPDKAGKTAQTALSDAIRNAWASANAACAADGSNPYDREWPLAV